MPTPARKSVGGTRPRDAAVRQYQKDAAPEPDAKRRKLPAGQAAANGTGGGQLHLLAPSSGGEDESRGAGGDASGDSTPGPGPSGAAMAREDSFAGTGASGEAVGLRGAAGVGDGRKRSRKASAPRRCGIQIWILESCQNCACCTCLMQLHTKAMSDCLRLISAWPQQAGLF